MSEDPAPYEPIGKDMRVAEIDARLDTVDEMLGDIRHAVLSAKTRDIKIEALRAAAAVQAALLSNPDITITSFPGVITDTKDIAEQFRAWLSES